MPLQLGCVARGATEQPVPSIVVVVDQGRSRSRHGAKAACLLPLRTEVARRRCGHEPSASPAALHAGSPQPRFHTRSLPCRWAVVSLPHPQVCGQQQRWVDSPRARAPCEAQSGTHGIQGSGRLKWVCCRLSWLLTREFPTWCPPWEQRPAGARTNGLKDGAPWLDVDERACDETMTMEPLMTKSSQCEF